MNELAELVAIEALKRLKARYCRLVDAKDWGGFARLFTPDAVLVPSGSTGDVAAKGIEGREAIVRWVSGKLAQAGSVHLAFLPEIQLDSPRSARGIWAMEDRVEWADRTLHGFGHYHETYALTADGWQIAHTSLMRTRFSWTGPSQAPGNPGT